jgi:hypothetical protein
MIVLIISYPLLSITKPLRNSSPALIMSIGAGLLTTLKVDTDHQIYIGYQVLYGFGLGFGMQQAGMAAQTCLDKKGVMIGHPLSPS